MKDDDLTQDNSEVLTWWAVDQLNPPLRSCLFLCLQVDLIDAIDFCTGFWDGQRFCFYPVLQIPAASPPRPTQLFPPWIKVTHWALSEQANKSYLRYAWDLHEQQRLPCGCIGKCDPYAHDTAPDWDGTPDGPYYTRCPECDGKIYEDEPHKCE
jgi:hypothetical protein